MAKSGMVQIKGLDEIEKRLQALPEKLRRRSLKKILQDNLDTVTEEARILAPRRLSAGWEAFVERGEHLRDAIVNKVSVTAKKAGGMVGLDYKKVRHGHLLEFGTKPHMIGKIKHPGSKARPFMRPALDNKGDAVLDDMTTKLAKAVEEEV